MFRLLFPLCLLLAAGYAAPCFSEEDIDRQRIQKIIPEFEKRVEEGMEQLHVPGVAVAIVYQDSPVVLKGFGFRNVEKQLSVTPDTVFQLASVSKPITSTVLACLVSQQKLQWDSKVSDLDPAFRLSDAWVTANLTIRDLLSHRSGLPDHAGDLLEDLGFNLDHILHQLRYIQPLHPFREHYAYTNFGYSEAAFAAGRSLGIPWNTLAKEVLYHPLGMTATSSSFADYNDSSLKATTYVIKNGKSIPLDPPRQPDAQSPAGGASSSVRDMAKWMILQMGGYQGKNIVDYDSLRETHNPIILTNMDKKSRLPTFYGMGWDITYDGDGRSFLKHSGGFSLGVRTQVALLPEKKLGIAVLTNASPTGLPEAISKIFYDLLFKGEVEEGLFEKYNQLWMQYQVDPQVHYVVKPDASTPSISLEHYEGKFQNDYYGELEIRKRNGGLELVIGPKTFPLKHLNRDVFFFETEGENAVGETQVIFTLDEENKVRQITVDYLNKFGAGTFTP